MPHTNLPIGRGSPWLAPLAGFTDLPFRLLCREMGATVTCTEMVSAKGLVFGERQGGKGGQGTWDLLQTNTDDSPLVVQLFGAEPEFLFESINILKGKGFSWFDLNMGCSVPKVTKAGAGAAMLKDIKNALAVAEAMLKAAGTGKVGFKMRLGWEAGAEVYEDLGKRLEDLGAGWLTLHPRYARQGFSGTADVKAIGKLAQAVNIPVMASGDLYTAKDGMDRLIIGASGVMFARGALANPAVFRQYLQMEKGLEPAPYLDAPELKKLILRHMELAREFTPGKPGKKGYPPALLKMRTVVPRYVKHLPGVKKLRLALTRCEDWEQLRDILHDFFDAAGQAEPVQL